MITKNDILKFTKHLVRRGKGFPDRRIMHPLREWVIGIGVSTTVFVGGAVYAGWVFVVQTEKIDNPQTQAVPLVEYKQDLVREVLVAYRARADAFARLRQEEGVVIVATSSATTTVEEE